MSWRAFSSGGCSPNSILYWISIDANEWYDLASMFDSYVIFLSKLRDTRINPRRPLARINTCICDIVSW